jgi:hypothetical protein
MTSSGAPQNTYSIHRIAAAPGKTDRILPADAPVRLNPKLLDPLREALRSRHYSRRTELTYCHWVKHFIVTMLPESLKNPYKTVCGGSRRFTRETYAHLLNRGPTGVRSPVDLL